MLIYRYTGGIPRLINILCDMAMTAAALHGSHVVTPRLVAEAIEELQWTDPAAPAGVVQVSRHWLATRAERALGATRRWLGVRVSWADVTTTGVRPLRWLRGSEQLRRVRKASSQLRRALTTRATHVGAAAENAIGVVRSAAKSASKQPFGQDLRSSVQHVLGAAYVARRPIAAAGALVAALVLVVSLQNKTPAPAQRVLAARTVSEVSPAPAAQTDAPTQFSDTVVEVLAAYNAQGKKVGPPKPRMPEGSLRMTSTLQRTFAPLPTTTVDIAIAPSPQISLPLMDANWLLEQPQDAYTIQLLGTHSPKNLTRFIRSQGLGADLAYYTVEREGKDWFVLVHGVYSDLPAARQARSQLPEKVRANQPWIRRLGEVHEVIRTTTPADRLVATHASLSDTTLLK